MPTGSGSCQDNVIVSILGAGYDARAKGNVDNPAPDAVGIPGFLTYNGLNKEGDQKGTVERERGSMYRWIGREPALTSIIGQGNKPNGDPQQELLRAGAYMIVTAQRHPAANSWVTLVSPIRYKIDFVTSTLGSGREKIVSLSLEPYS